MLRDPAIDEVFDAGLDNRSKRAKRHAPCMSERFPQKSLPGHPLAAAQERGIVLSHWLVSCWSTALIFTISFKFMPFPLAKWYRRNPHSPFVLVAEAQALH